MHHKIANIRFCYIFKSEKISGVQPNPPLGYGLAYESSAEFSSNWKEEWYDGSKMTSHPLFYLLHQLFRVF